MKEAKRLSLSNKIIISVGNVNSNILAPDSLLEDLHSVFAYEVEDASYIRDAKISFYMKLGRSKDARKWAEWDGKFSVFNKYKFGTGILGDVMMYLYDNDYDVELIDKTHNTSERLSNLSLTSTTCKNKGIQFRVVEPFST